MGSVDGDPVKVSLLTTNSKGEAMSGDLFSKIVWKPAFGKADLEYVNRADGMHSGLRHLYASKLLSRGVSVKNSPTTSATKIGASRSACTRTCSHPAMSAPARLSTSRHTSGSFVPRTAWKRPEGP